MADNELTIYLKLITAEADAADQAYHARSRDRLKEAQAELRRFDKERENRLRQSLADQSKMQKENAKEISKFMNEQQTVEFNRRKAAFKSEFSEIQADRKKMYADSMNEINKESRQRAAAAKDAVAGHRSVTGAAKETEGAVMNIARAYTTLRIASEVSQGMTTAMQAVAMSLKESKDYVQGLVEGMERVRERTTEILANRGRMATGAGAAGLAGEAANNMVPFDHHLKFTEEVQAQIQGQVGGTGRIRDNEQMAELSSMAEQYGKLYGIEPSVTGKILGAAVNVGKVGPDGKIDTNNTIVEFAQILEQARLSVGRTHIVAPQIASVAQQTVGEDPGAVYKDIQDAAMLVRAEAAIKPAGAEVNAMALTRAMREVMTREDKKYGINFAEEIGLTRDMSIEEKMAKIEDAIPGMAKDLELGEDEVAALITGNEVRKARGFRGYRKAMKEGLFTRMRAEAARVDLPMVQKRIGQFRGSDNAMADQEKSRAEQAKLERGDEYKNLRLVQLQAATEMISAGNLENPEELMNAILTGSGTQFGKGDRQQQELQRGTIHKIVSRLSMSPEGRAALEPFTPRMAWDRKTPIDKRVAGGTAQAAGMFRMNEPGGYLDLNTDQSVLKDLSDVMKKLDKKLPQNAQPIPALAAPAGGRP